MFSIPELANYVFGLCLVFELRPEMRNFSVTKIRAFKYIPFRFKIKFCNIIFVHGKLRHRKTVWLIIIIKNIIVTKKNYANLLFLRNLHKTNEFY